MKITRKMTLEIGPEEIKDMVINYLKDEGYETIVRDDVRFNVIMEDRSSHPMCEDYGPVFKGILVNADKEINKSAKESYLDRS